MKNFTIILWSSKSWKFLITSRKNFIRILWSFNSWRISYLSYARHHNLFFEIALDQKPCKIPKDFRGHLILEGIWSYPIRILQEFRIDLIFCSKYFYGYILWAYEFRGVGTYEPMGKLALLNIFVSETMRKTDQNAVFFIKKNLGCITVTVIWNLIFYRTSLISKNLKTKNPKINLLPFRMVTLWVFRSRLTILQTSNSTTLSLLPVTPKTTPKTTLKTTLKTTPKTTPQTPPKTRQLTYREGTSQTQMNCHGMNSYINVFQHHVALETYGDFPMFVMRTAGVPSYLHIYAWCCSSPYLCIFWS